MFGLWKKKTKGSVGTLRGPGEYALDIVGESHYQKTFLQIVGKKTEEGFNKAVDAILIPEDSNPYDKKAVRVEVMGRAVGYLDRETARSYRERLKEQNLPPLSLMCSAMIVGGWDRGNGDTGYFGLKLDLPIEE